MVNVNDKAPEFVLTDQNDRKVRLSDFSGKRVLLAFYPSDWSPVCSTEMKCLMNDLNEIRNAGIEIVAISVDSVWSHKAWADHIGTKFPILSDFSRETTRKYGLLRPEGFSERAYILLDEKGIVKWKHVMPSPSERLENNDILNAIKHIR